MFDFDVELMESVFKTEIASHGFVSDAMIDLFRKIMHKHVDATLNHFIDSIQPAERYANLLLSECPAVINNEIDWAPTYAKLLDLPESMLSSFDFDQFKDNQFGSKELNQYEFNKTLDWITYKYCGMYEYELVENSENKYINALQNQEPPKPIRGKNGVVAHLDEDISTQSVISPEGLHPVNETDIVITSTELRNIASHLLATPCGDTISKKLMESIKCGDFKYNAHEYKV